MADNVHGASGRPHVPTRDQHDRGGPSGPDVTRKHPGVEACGNGHGRAEQRSLQLSQPRDPSCVAWAMPEVYDRGRARRAARHDRVLVRSKCGTFASARHRARRPRGGRREHAERIGQGGAFVAQLYRLCESYCMAEILDDVTTDSTDYTVVRSGADV